MLSTCQPDSGPNVARSSSRLTRRGPPVPGSASLKQSRCRTAPGAVDGGQAGHVTQPFLIIECVEEAAIEDRVEGPIEPIESQCVGDQEGRIEPTLGRLPPRLRQRGRSHVDADGRQSQRGQLERVLTSTATDVEHPAGERTAIGEPNHRRLRATDIPGRRPVLIRAVPVPPGLPFVPGRCPVRIVGGCRRLCHDYVAFRFRGSRRVDHGAERLSIDHRGSRSVPAQNPVAE